MLKQLASIKDISDLKKIDEKDLPKLAAEIRKFLIQSIATTGGHLASNLGVVELTIALHYLFNSPQDKMIWDVGHQAYVHKLLTGRRAAFRNLRKLGGMSGFPKRVESPHDVFETGHSSTSISAALGMAVARDLKQDKHHVIAIIGDGALTGGMAFEALNHAGRGNTNLIVILNDNEMSISENVGGMSKHLSKLRSAREYLKVKEDVEGILTHVPLVGETVLHTMKRTKEGIKSFLSQNTIFEEMGFTYLGPINGHSFEDLIKILENAKEMKGPILIHVKTQKGRGYVLAEQNPSAYHGVGPFDIKEGLVSSKDNVATFSSAFGEAMVKMGQEDESLLAITAAMREGTGLLAFSKAYPKRFFDVGIAEQHAVTFAAGLAMAGYRPIVAIYSSFLQRAYDQILHDVALQNLPVIFAVDRAGLVGEDGSTHQGIFDIAFLSSIPNMTILAPKMTEEIEAALYYARGLNAPVAIRYPRGGSNLDKRYINDYKDVALQMVEEGEAVALIATGKMVELALEIREYVEAQGTKISVVFAPQVYPLPETSIDEVAKVHHHLFTLEDHILTDGFGMQLASYLKLNEKDNLIWNFGYKESCIEHGSVKELLKRQGLSKEALGDQILLTLRKKRV